MQKVKRNLKAIHLPKLIEKLVKKHGKLLISILEDIQEEYNYLPEEALKEVSKKLNIPLRDVYGVATFYRAFRLTPTGEHLINVCLGTSCHVRGGLRILEKIERDLNIKSGESNKEFTLETVNCLGACALSPLVVVDKEYYGNITPNKVNSILKKYKGGKND